MRIKLGVVSHFGLAVKNPEASAKFWSTNFDLDEMFRFEDGIAVNDDAITIALFKGTPRPEAIEHLAFFVKDMHALRQALDVLKKNGVEVEDPGDEIGPEAPGSAHMGLWFHDPDGYRWELSVRNGAKEVSQAP